MSTMYIVLYISYALPHCTTEMVSTKFDSMFVDPCVTYVGEELLDDTRNVGKKFKRFWICVECRRHDPMMKWIMETIEKEGTAKVYYEKTKGVDRFWKVKIVPEISLPQWMHRG